MDKRKNLRTIMDREKLSSAPTCPACGKDFTLGEQVVLACGDWGNTPKLVHEKDTVYDEATESFVERKCYEFRQKSRQGT